MISRSLKDWKLRFGLGVPPSTGMREALQWLMLARLGVLYLVLASIAVQQIFRREHFTESQLCLGYGLLATSFAFNLFFSVVVEKVSTQWWVAGLHIIFDCAVTSAWIYFSGTGDSAFALLYLIQILLVALILFQKGAWFSAVTSSLCFGLVTVFLSSSAGLGNWLVFSAIFLSVGVVGGYLSEELHRTSLSLTEKQRKIELLTVLHERILSNMPTGLLTVDRDMRINFVNPAGAAILEKSSSDLVGKSLAEAEPGLLPFFTSIEAVDIPDEESEEPDTAGREASLSSTGSEHHRTFFVQSRSDKRQARLQQRVEIKVGSHFRILRGDVAALDAAAGVGSLLDEEASGARVLLFQDVTKILHLEEKLKQNEKLAAVGQLAAGIAHEIRNPLASMSASIEMLKAGFPADGAYGENRKLMDIAIREIDRLNGLISEFLDFVKPDKFKFERVPLEKVMSDLVFSARSFRSAKFKFEIKEVYEPNVIAHANAEKLKQVIWNLLVNAIQAMHRDGVIEVGISRAGTARVKFWVADQGQGMSEEVLAHLYEPFFTTKEKGTGLGLPTAYKIVEAHHGEIRVTSKVNEGTRFEVLLQAAA